MAVGCSHGDLAHPDIIKQVLKFKKDFDPKIRFELGDLIDTAAFRTGARGTKDESRPLAPDYNSAVRWLQRYEPTHVSWGNHDHRLVELADSSNAIVAHAASTLWNGLQDETKRLHAETVEYDYERNWFYEGGTYWGHGFWYGEHALRDHAEYLGGPVVMAHLHVAQQQEGRTRVNSRSFCVGTLGDIDQFGYARRRRNTSRWNHGVVFGEMCETEAVLWLASAPKGGQLRFPI